MNTNTLGLKRHSTKAFDPNKKIDQATWQTLQQVLRFSPSSTNSQPWHFVYTDNDQGKARLQKALGGNFAYNAAKVKNASHVVVLCASNEVGDQHLAGVLAQEDKDGRYPTPEAKEAGKNVRGGYVDLHRTQIKDVAVWAQKQVYLALGFLLMSAEVLGVDACPMEGFDSQILNEELGLTARGFDSTVLVALGYSGADNFNATLPKSRLSIDKVFTAL